MCGPVNTARKLLTTATPSEALLSDAYTKGRRAGHTGLTSAANPYPEGTAEHLHWRQGLNSSVLDAELPAGAPSRSAIPRRPLNVVADDTQ